MSMATRSGETEDETRQNATYVRYRFEPLYKEISMEATRFLMLIFKRAPRYGVTVQLRSSYFHT